MPQLSVVIITFNEEKNIGRCLDSVKEIADDIVVADSFSTDNTEKIARQYPVNFISCQWQGYSSTKNFANSQAKYGWILSLDADEALSDELKRSIAEAKAASELQTFKFNRLTNYCGTWIKHCGWYPDTKVRLFNRNSAHWQGDIHEKLNFQTKENVLLLKGDCFHYSYYTIEQHYKQTEKFAALSAQSMFQNGKKASLIKLYVNPVIKFLNTYFLKLGFLDGYHGFVICKISAKSTFLKYRKLQDLYAKTSL